MFIAKAGILHRKSVCKSTIYTFPICARRILLEFKYTFQYVMGYVWNAECLNLCKKISPFPFYNIASFSVFQISDYRFEIMVLNGPFCVGFNWFVPLFVNHTLSQKLATICLLCCLPFLIAVIPINVKCHFSVFQYALSLQCC